MVSAVAQNNLQIPPIEPQREIDPRIIDDVPQLKIDPFSLPSGVDLDVGLERLLIIARIDFDGNTIFPDDKIQKIVDQYLGKQIKSSDLRQLEKDITQLYRDEGYIASGAFIPPSSKIDPDNAVIFVQIVEGSISDIEINGAKRLKSYVKKRLNPLQNKPIKQSKLFNRLRFLLNEAQIENLNVDIQPQQVLGRNKLVVNIVPGQIFEKSALFSNGRSPTVGTFERGITLNHRNLVGIGDEFQLDFRNTDGSNVISADYGIPLTADGGRINISYLFGSSQIIEEPFEPFNLESEVQQFAVSFEQPIFRKSSNSSLQELIIGVGGRRTENEDTIDNFPFPITEGADINGQTRTTVFNAFQRYQFRSNKNTLVLNSDISFGVDLGNENDPIFEEGEFVKWVAQGAYSRRFSDRIFSITKASIQLADRSLVSNEQFILGGNSTIRGFRQNGISRDNGLVFSNELKFLLFRDDAQKHKLEFSPFFDLGHGFNDVDQFLEQDTTIASIGFGVDYSFSDRVIVNFEYGIPIIGSNDTGNSLQESGVFLGLQIRF